MKKPKEGDYVHLENSEIKRHIELLRANGYPIWSKQTSRFRFTDNVVIFEDETFSSDHYDNVSDNIGITKLSKHDWVCAVIGLEEGDALDSDSTNSDQRKQIAHELSELGVNVYTGIKPYLNSYGLVFHENMVHATDDYIKKLIPYLDFCQKLGVGPIYAEEPTIYKMEITQIITLADGSTVDLTKPIEVSMDAEDWELLYEESLFLGKMQNGVFVFDIPSAETTCDLLGYTFIRNKPEPEFKEGQPVFYQYPTKGTWFFGYYFKFLSSRHHVKDQNNAIQGEVIVKPAINPDGSPNFPPFKD